MTGLGAGGATAPSDFRPCEHPFLLWNSADIAELRQRLETESWARDAWNRWMSADTKSSSPSPYASTLRNLARWAVLGDREAAKKEKEELLRVLRSPIPRGGAQWITVLRYDLLYDELSADERKSFEEMARIYINNAIFDNAVFNPNLFNDSAHYSRYDARKYTRSNWLPNIIWPRKVSANLMAAALRDEDLIRTTWAAYGSWKWYFDEYLCDIGFYNEEFSKMGSTPGAMLLYCRALRRLGLDDMGLAYRGKNGATMRGHIESLLHLAYPRIELHSSRPQYPMVTIGDLRQGGSSQGRDFPTPAFQHSLVVGYLPDGAGGNVWWRAHGAWGGTIRGSHAQWDGYTGFTPKMQIPFWFELGHALWPEVGFDYFLVQMRGDQEEQFYPSLLFGLEPIHPDSVAPPPAPSAVWPQRGIVMLRANESHEYWESPAPAVAMRLATNYAHRVNDSFALAGFYAFSRPIYLNRQVTPGYADGWSRSIQSHCGVMVDAEEPRVTDATRTRQLFTDAVKYCIAESADVYPGIRLSRSLMLTREYLLDVTHLDADEAHDHYWLVHALGNPQFDEASPWTPGRLPEGLSELSSVRVAPVGDKCWSVLALQSCALGNPEEVKLPQAWYDRHVGVRLTMLGETGTTSYTAQTPQPRVKTRDRDVEIPSEVGGLTVIVHRRKPTTSYAALHEPFEGGKWRLVEFRRVAQSNQGLVMAIRGSGDSPVNDRAMMPFTADGGEMLTLTGERERYTFSGAVHLRIRRDRIAVSGDLSAMSLEVEGRPRLTINGKQVPTVVNSGLLQYAY